jgi:hypothetical protein
VLIIAPVAAHSELECCRGHEGSGEPQLKPSHQYGPVDGIPSKILQGHLCKAHCPQKYSPLTTRPVQ